MSNVQAAPSLPPDQGDVSVSLMRPYVGRCWRQGRCAALLSLLYWLYLLKSETVQSSGTTLRTLVMTGGDAASIGCVPSEAFNCSYAAFRIPALVNAGGALIAFAEGRRYSCNDFGSSPIVDHTKSCCPFAPLVWSTMGRTGSTTWCADDRQMEASIGSL